MYCPSTVFKEKQCSEIYPKSYGEHSGRAKSDVTQRDISYPTPPDFAYRRHLQRFRLSRRIVLIGGFARLIKQCYFSQGEIWTRTLPRTSNVQYHWATTILMSFPASSLHWSCTVDGWIFRWRLSRLGCSWTRYRFSADYVHVELPAYFSLEVVSSCPHRSANQNRVCWLA